MGAWVGLLPQAPPPQTAGEVANSYAKLGELSQQRQIQAQQVQENALKIQAAQQAQADSEAMTQHLIETQDPQKALEAAIQKGDVSAGGIQRAQQLYNETAEKAVQIDAGKAKQLKENSDSVKEYLQQVVAAKNEQDAAAAWSVGLQQAAAQGLDVSKFQQQYPGKSVADSLLAGSIMNSHFADLAVKKQEAATSAARETREQAKADQDAKEAPAKLEKAQADADTANLNLAARTVPDFPSAPSVGPVDPAVQGQWASWRDTLPDGTKKYVPETYSAAAVAQVKKMGLTGYQESQAEARTVRNNRAAEMPAKNTIELQELASNPNVDEETRQMANSVLAQRQAKRGGLSEAQYHQYNNQKEEFQAKEAQQWKMVGEYGDAINTADGETFRNPQTNKTETMDEKTRAFLTKQYEGARTSANDLQQRSKAIRAKIGAGEFEGKPGSKVEAPAAEQSAAPAAQAKPATGSATQKYKAGQTVFYQGKPRKVSDPPYDKNGKLLVE